MGGDDAADILDDSAVRRRPADARSRPRVSADRNRAGHRCRRAIEGDQPAGADAADGPGRPASLITLPASRAEPSAVTAGARPVLALLISLSLHGVRSRARRGTRAQLLRAL